MNKSQNNNSFAGLDLSLNGSQINPTSNNLFGTTSTPKKQGIARPESAMSTRSYLLHRTNSNESLSKRSDSSRSIKDTPKPNRSSLYSQNKATTPTTSIKFKKPDQSNEAKKSSVFNILTARSSCDDKPIPSASQNTNSSMNLTNEKPPREIGFSMFLTGDEKSITSSAQSSSTLASLKKPHTSPKNHMHSYKDSLDIAISAKLDMPDDDVRDDEQTWKDEMMIYEKYLKEDYKKFEKNFIDDFEPAASINDVARKSTTVQQSTSSTLTNGSTAKSTGNHSKMKLFHEGLSSMQQQNESKHKIEKLKSSVDNLRRDLENEIVTNDAKLHLTRLNELKRKIAARKLQRWYRRHCLRKKSGEAALKRLMQQKKEEIVNREKGEKEKKMRQLLLDKQKKEERSSELRQLRIKEYQKKREEETAPKPIEPKITPRTPNKSFSNKPATPRSDPVRETLKANESIGSSIKTELLADSANITNDVKSLDNSVKSNKTIDDIFEAVKALEKVEQFPTPPNTDNSHLSESTVTLTNGNNGAKKLDEMKTAASLSNQKLNSILSFLNDVDSDVQMTETSKAKSKSSVTNRKPYKEDINKFFEPEQPDEYSELTDRQNKSTNRTNTYAPRPVPIIPMPMVPSAEEIENMEKATQAASEVTNTMLAQRLELEEKKRTITMLQKALNQQRELTVRHTKETEKELQMRFDMQKQEYEATIQRHLNFIDQLIDDKKTLSEKCEKLVKELKDVDKKYGDRIRTLEDNFRIETTKIKDMHEAAEKIRRQKWVEEQTKRIKENTVKGLEPELQNLIVKHKNEIKTLKAIHEAEMLQADERAAQRYIRMTEELRENYEREKESSVVKERELAKQRYEKSIQDEEKSYLEQRRRLYAEVEEEKNRVAEQASKQRQELDKLRKALEENNMHAIEGMRKEYEASRNEQERRHLSEIKDLKERLDIEKQTWEETYIKKQEAILAQKEREMRDRLRTERDKEIELVIARLEAETTSSREETERAAENRVKRIRDKYETELREVEKTERETTERYNTIKAKYNELEGENERNKVVLRQKDKELADVHRITETLQQERSRLADIIRQEFSDRIVFTEEESKRTKLEIAEIKSKQQYEAQKKQEEIEKLKSVHEEELSQLLERIKQANAKKDESVNQLKQQFEAATKRADHLEGLLEQQRKLMLMKK